MPVEPKIKRVVAFVDGQNLFFAAKEAFGYRYPNYDVQKLVAGTKQGGTKVSGTFITLFDSRLAVALWSRDLIVARSE